MESEFFSLRTQERKENTTSKQHPRKNTLPSEVLLNKLLRRKKPGSFITYTTKRSEKQSLNFQPTHQSRTDLFLLFYVRFQFSMFGDFPEYFRKKESGVLEEIAYLSDLESINFE